MDSVDIVWVTYHKDILARFYWDQGILEDIFKQGNYTHHIGFDDYWKNAKHDGAIVIINGRTHASAKDYAKLNEDIKPLRWVILIITGDEESLFDHIQVKHPLMTYWVQLPRLNKHNDVHRLVNGYRPTTREILGKVSRYQDERTCDWMFAGQITHRRREQCEHILQSAEMQKLQNVFITTKTFGEEAIEYSEYLTAMSHTKFVLCPSGPESPDSFRVWEALEAGCIPIVDSHSTNNEVPGFWEYLLGNDMPFPIVNEWYELPTLMPQLLKEYPHNANRAFAWWQLHKFNLKRELEKEITAWI